MKRWAILARPFGTETPESTAGWKHFLSAILAAPVLYTQPPDKSDGELALWLDGKLVEHFGLDAGRSRWTGTGFSLVEAGGEAFEGIRWRAKGGRGGELIPK